MVKLELDLGCYVNSSGSEWPEEDLIKTLTPVNQTFAGITGLLQGFQNVLHEI